MESTSNLSKYVPSSAMYKPNSVGDRERGTSLFEHQSQTFLHRVCYHYSKLLRRLHRPRLRCTNGVATMSPSQTYVAFIPMQNYPWSSIRASPVILGSASASGIEKWPPSMMQMQMQIQAKLLCIHASSVTTRLNPNLNRIICNYPVKP
jgi:hypothetical protein